MGYQNKALAADATESSYRTLDGLLADELQSAACLWLSWFWYHLNDIEHVYGASRRDVFTLGDRRPHNDQIFPLMRIFRHFHINIFHRSHMFRRLQGITMNCRQKANQNYTAILSVGLPVNNFPCLGADDLDEALRNLGEECCF